MKRCIVVVAVALLFTVFAIAQDKTQAAEQASQAWLRFVDSGDYSQSWLGASSLFKAAVTRKFAEITLWLLFQHPRLFSPIDVWFARASGTISVLGNKM